MLDIKKIQKISENVEFELAANEKLRIETQLREKEMAIALSIQKIQARHRALRLTSTIKRKATRAAISGHFEVEYGVSIGVDMELLKALITDAGFKQRSILSQHLSESDFIKLKERLLNFQKELVKVQQGVVQIEGFDLALPSRLETQLELILEEFVPSTIQEKDVRSKELQIIISNWVEYSEVNDNFIAWIDSESLNNDFEKFLCDLKALLVHSKISRHASELNIEFEKQTIQWKHCVWEKGNPTGEWGAYALNWLSSKVGQHFLLKLDSCIQSSAKSGHRKISMEYIRLESNPVRWGNNSVGKAVIDGSPIGAVIFSTKTLSYVLKTMGFSVVVKKTNSDYSNLMISW